MTSTIDSGSISKPLFAFCTAESYNLKELAEYFKKKYKVTFFKDVIYVGLNSSHTVKDIFCFTYGTAVFWGIEDEEVQAFLNELKLFEYKPLDQPEKEVMTFCFGTPGQAAQIKEDEITLPDNDIFSRLAVSHGIAQSVKLANFENVIQKTIDTTKNIPEQLALKGRIPLSKKEIRKKMGELFIERSSVNLHSDILDIPEFFWDHSEVESLYTMIAHNLDLETRIEVLNQRLDTVHDLFEVLGNELNHQHSSRLEWFIIWLLVFEVIITLLRDVFDLI